MAILDAMVAPFEARARTSGVTSPTQWLIEAMGGPRSKAGKSVTERTAARVSTVFACVRIISEDVSRLPLHMYERTDEGRQRASGHPLYPRITGRANPEMPMKTFRELITGHAALWGAGYAEIELNEGGRPVAFWPLLPNCTKAVRHDGVKYLVTTLLDGTQEILRPGQYLHIPGPAWLNDGLDGDHPVRLAREAIGIAMAAEEYGARLFGNGALQSGLLISEKKLNEDQRKQVETGWKKYTGISNAHRSALLEANLKWQPTSINPDDAQSLETRRFQVEEVARYYRMPLVLLGHTEKATSWGTGIEQFMRGYVTHTLGSWLTRWEEWMAHHLLSERDSQAYYFEHVLEDLLKNDIATRFQAYATAVQNGWMNRNEVRIRENMNRIPGDAGDAYTAQLNMAELGEVVGAALVSVLGRGGLPPAASDPSAAKPEPRGLLPGASGFPVTVGGGATAVRVVPDGGNLLVEWASPSGTLRTEQLSSSVSAEKAQAFAVEKARRLGLAQRSLRSRRRLERRFREVFHEAFGRAVRREASHIRRLAKRLDPVDGDLDPERFVAEVADFYEMETLRGGEAPAGHMAWFAREYRRPLTAYAELVRAEVLEEREEEDAEDNLGAVIPAYITRFLRRHGARSTNQMQKLARTVQRELLREALEQRMDEWEERRPDKMAQEESVHAGGSVARMTYFVVGVVSLEWVAFGENCPLCDELTGKVVGIQEAFLRKGERIDPDDEDTAPLETKRSILNPPLHAGCDCGIVAAS